MKNVHVFTLPALLVAASLSLNLSAPVVQADTVAEDGHIVFGVISDTHVTPSKTLQRERFSEALKFFSGTSGPVDAVDALAVVGDLTDSGTASELGQWGAIKNADLAPSIPLLASMGNHESSNYAAFEANTGNKPSDVAVIGGYHFITVSPGAGTMNEATGRPTSANTSSYSYAVPWLERQLAIAEAASPDRPVFVFFHHPIRNTFYVSNEWYGSGFETVFANHPRAVTFSGHIHSPNNHPLSIWQDGGFTAVNTVTTSYFELESGMIYGTVPPKASQAAQGMVIEVEGSQVTIKNWDFLSKTWIDQTWSFDVTRPLPYTDAARRPRAVAPVFGDDAGIRVFNIRDSRVNIEFDQARIPANDVQDIVHSYRYEFVDEGTGRIDANFATWSDYYFLPWRPTLLYYDSNGDPADVTGLKPGTNYLVRITAYDAWGLASAPLTTTFTTTGDSDPSTRPATFDELRAGYLPVDLLDVDFGDGSARDNSARAHTISGGSGNIAYDATMGKPVASFSQNSAQAFRVPWSTEDYAKTNDGLTLEVVFKAEAFDNASYVDLVGNMQSAGFGLEIPRPASLTSQYGDMELWAHVGGNYVSAKRSSDAFAWGQ